MTNIVISEGRLSDDARQARGLALSFRALTTPGGREAIRVANVDVQRVLEIANRAGVGFGPRDLQFVEAPYYWIDQGSVETLCDMAEKAAEVLDAGRLARNPLRRLRGVRGGR
jgi:hypothetical protein